MSRLEDKIQVRIDADTKKQAKKTLAEMGINMSSAVQLFLQQVVTTESLPFRPRTENGFTPEKEAQIIRETEEALESGKRYENYEEMVADIENETQ
jgi:DNA-damage-inducible protein J